VAQSKWFSGVSKERVSFVVKDLRSVSNLDLANCIDEIETFFRKLATSFRRRSVRPQKIRILDYTSVVTSKFAYRNRGYMRQNPHGKFHPH